MITSAAVKIVLDDYCGTIICIPVHRHKDAISICQSLLGYKPFIEEEGFLTDTGDFLDREKALFYAIECGQLEEDPEDLAAITSGVLMSEDLW